MAPAKMFASPDAAYIYGYEQAAAHCHLEGTANGIEPALWTTQGPR